MLYVIFCNFFCRKSLSVHSKCVNLVLLKTLCFLTFNVGSFAK